jgi:hypothetical protein
VDGKGQRLGDARARIAPVDDSQIARELRLTELERVLDGRREL